MNILILNHEFPPIGGGAASATAYIARELSSLGARITVMTAAYNGHPRMEIQDGFSVIRVPSWRRDALESHPHEIVSYLAGAMLKALPRCLRSGPDLIHAFFGVPSGALAYALNRLAGIPYLISFRGRDVHGGKGADSGGISGPLRTVSRTVWRRADALVANSLGLREIALRVDPDSDVEVIPNGIDTGRFTPGPSAGPGRALRLLFVGRLEPYKRLPDLFEALRIVRDRTHRPLSLCIAGDGSLRHSLPDAARRFGVAECIRFCGAVSGGEMPALYRDADIFILPSIVEGMPNVVLEAMAAGLPVLATRIPGSEELVVPGKTGFLVPPTHPQALADALLALIENDALRLDMGRRARREAEARSWNRVAESYLEIYRRIVKGKMPCAASAAS